MDGTEIAAGVRPPAPDGRLVDLSHEIADGLVTYPGLPAPVIRDFLSREASRAHYAPGTEFHIGRIDMVANTGTYLDTPAHRYAGGRDLAGLPLAAVADLEGVVVRATRRPGRAVDAGRLGAAEVRGKAVLVHTGWAAHWGTARYFEGHPFLATDAVARLVAAGAALVGIDSLNIDDTTTGERPAHSGLLAADIPIVEHLCRLERLPDRGFRFFAVPVKVRGLGTFPVRAFAIV
jgi:kynurenine formamidase